MSEKRKKTEWWKRRSPGFLAGDSPAKIFFLVLSVFLWFLIKFSKEGVVGEVNYPVEYVNIPVEKRLKNLPPQKLMVTLRAKGFDVLKYKIGSLRPMQIDVSELASAQTNRYTWNTDAQRSLISSKFEDDTEVLDIKPDTVYFEFEDLISKKVKVYLRAKKQLSNFRAVYDAPQLEPDSILISGPPEVVNPIDSVFTKSITLTGKEDSLIRPVNLDIPKKKNLEFSHTQVQLKVKFSSLTEGSVEVPVNIINLPEQYAMVVFPAKVTVNFRVPVNDFSRVNENDFEIYVSYKSLAGAENDADVRFLPVALKSYPAYIRQVNIRPARVEYILTKKQ